MLYHRSDLFGGKPIYSGSAAGFSANGKHEKESVWLAATVPGESWLGRGVGGRGNKIKKAHMVRHMWVGKNQTG